MTPKMERVSGTESHTRLDVGGPPAAVGKNQEPLHDCHEVIRPVCRVILVACVSADEKMISAIKRLSRGFRLMLVECRWQGQCSARGLK